MTESKKRFLILSLKPFVANLQAFGVIDIERLHSSFSPTWAGRWQQFNAWNFRMGKVCVTLRERNGELARWINVAKKYIGNRLRATDARIPGFEHGSHFIRPRHGHWSAAFYYNNRVRIRRDDGFNQGILIVWEGKRGCVTAFTHPLVDEYDCDL